MEGLPRGGGLLKRRRVHCPVRDHPGHTALMRPNLILVSRITWAAGGFSIDLDDGSPEPGAGVRRYSRFSLGTICGI